MTDILTCLMQIHLNANQNDTLKISFQSYNKKNGTKRFYQILKVCVNVDADTIVRILKKFNVTYCIVKDDTVGLVGIKVIILK